MISFDPMVRRILFVTPPGYGHVFPIVPLARALCTAGHQVLVATCGVSLNAAASAGLSVVDVAPRLNLLRLYDEFRDSFRSSAEAIKSPVPPDIFTVIADLTIENVVGAAQSWNTDLIVYTPEAAAGPLVASKLKIPSIFLGIGLMHTPDLMYGKTYSRMTKTLERLAIDRLEVAHSWIDVAPPSLRIEPKSGRAMQYVPYNGEATVGLDFLRRGATKRVLVTLGTVIPFIHTKLLTWLPKVAGQVDANFVVALGARRVHLGSVPSNVEFIDWIPLDKLVSTCDAVIHHGGSGTTLTALRAGLPQLVLPEGADEFFNAGILALRGAALNSDSNSITASDVYRLLNDLDLHAVAREVREEIYGMPSPDAVARWLSCVRDFDSVRFRSILD